ATNDAPPTSVGSRCPLARSPVSSAGQAEPAGVPAIQTVLGDRLIWQRDCQLPRSSTKEPAQQQALPNDDPASRRTIDRGSIRVLTRRPSVCALGALLVEAPGAA